MNTMPSGVRQSLATSADRPTTTTTWSSTPAAASVARSLGSVSSRPVAGATRPGPGRRAPQPGRGGGPAGRRVHQPRVVVLPAGLVLLRAVMVVHGNHQ